MLLNIKAAKNNTTFKPIFATEPTEPTEPTDEEQQGKSKSAYLSCKVLPSQSSFLFGFLS